MNFSYIENCEQMELLLNCKNEYIFYTIMLFYQFRVIDQGLE